MATIKKILDGLQGCDSYDLYQWMIFLSTKIPCRDCADVCVENNKIPDCLKCIPTGKIINIAKKNLEEKEQSNGIKIKK